MVETDENRDGLVAYDEFKHSILSMEGVNMGRKKSDAVAEAGKLVQATIANESRKTSTNAELDKKAKEIMKSFKSPAWESLN